ncbi:MAG: yedO [Gammaproteobacteria bacterium]|nr:yedO [Gammaproteobacteria bacterium]
MDKIKKLTQVIQPLVDYPYHTRVHKLKTFNTSTLDCYVKRDDELSFGVSGSKLRKYLSLIPYLLNNKIDTTILMGSSHSNNILSLSQLLIENAIEPHLFLLGDKSHSLKGNLLLTRLFVPEKNIHWISRQEWPSVEAIAQDYGRRLSEKHTYLIAEGASVLPALPGALTLALDILQNEQLIAKQFDHIFIDAGTGLIAIATILAFSWLRRDVLAHVLLLAEEEASFLQRLESFKLGFEKLIGEKLAMDFLIGRIRFYRPTKAKAFGSTNPTIFKTISRIAQQEGFLTDPIYSAKLFIEVPIIIEKQKLSGKALIIHSGGGLSLMGFQQQLIKQIIS